VRNVGDMRECGIGHQDHVHLDLNRAGACGRTSAYRPRRRSTWLRDYNDDCRNDLFTVRASNGRYLFAAGTGDGEFGMRIARSRVWRVFDLVEGVGDVTGDARPDVIARTPAGDVHLYAGTIGGAFVPQGRIANGWQIYDQLEGAGDLDSDGDNDVFARRRSDGRSVLIAGDGDGDFAAPVVQAATFGAFDVIEAVGDLDGDRRNDLLARRRSSGRAVFLAGTGEGGFATGVTVDSGWRRFDWIEGVGDLDGDGHNDVFTRRAADGRYLFHPGLGDGNFGPPVVQSDGWAAFEPITQ
jgi:hypothetical protein